MSDTPETPPLTPPPTPSRPVLSVLGVLALVAVVVAGAVVLAQRADDRAATQGTTDTSVSGDASTPADAPTPEGEPAPGDLDDLPTIDPSDFLDEQTLPADLSTEFGGFPTQFPTDDAGWQEWADSQLEEMAQ